MFLVPTLGEKEKLIQLRNEFDDLELATPYIRVARGQLERASSFIASSVPSSWYLLWNDGFCGAKPVGPPGRDVEQEYSNWARTVITKTGLLLAVESEQQIRNKAYREHRA